MTRLISIIAALLAAAAASAQPDRRAGDAPETAGLAAAMTSAASALLQSVRGDPEFSEVLRGYSMEDHLLLAPESPEKRNWTYWPTERAGLKFDLMHTKHRALTQELMWTLLSAKGYHRS